MAVRGAVAARVRGANITDRGDNICGANNATALPNRMCISNVKTVGTVLLFMVLMILIGFPLGGDVKNVAGLLKCDFVREYALTKTRSIML